MLLTTTTRGERGSMAVELVILTPFLVAVMMLVVAFGKYVDTRGVVEAVARDAVRAASLERTYDEGRDAAQRIVDGTMPNRISCDPVNLDGTFDSGQIITVGLTCHVSYDGLGFIGMPGEVQIVRESSAPIDTLRRTG